MGRKWKDTEISYENRYFQYLWKFAAFREKALNVLSKTAIEVMWNRASPCPSLELTSWPIGPEFMVESDIISNIHIHILDKFESISI